VPDDDPTPALVARARRGEAAAVEGLVRRHLRPAYSVALAIVARPSDAEDVAQDAMIIACERLDTCRDPARFTAWLFQTGTRRRRRRCTAAPRRTRRPSAGRCSRRWSS
jgi:RNA polymerase sigma-70 factor (ECF subfamily)